MTLLTALFVLRILSTFALLMIVTVLFMVIWRDYRSAAAEIEASRQVYGYLVGLVQEGNELEPTGEVYPLTALTTMGRAPTNSVRLDDQFASTEHARLVLRNGVWWLEDQNSRNGTVLNSIPVDQPLIIADGDIVGIGRTHFRVEIERV